MIITTKKPIYISYITLLVFKLTDLIITHIAINFYRAIELNPLGYNALSWILTISIMVVLGLFVLRTKDSFILKLILGLIITFIIVNIVVLSHNFNQLISMLKWAI